MKEQRLYKRHTRSQKASSYHFITPSGILSRILLIFKELKYKNIEVKS